MFLLLISHFEWFTDFEYGIINFEFYTNYYEYSYMNFAYRVLRISYLILNPKK